MTDALAAAGETVETEEQSGERGESLLLPLLQGLLQGGGQRLLAGLGAASHDVVADVRRSLQRLRLALAPPNDHPQARALLALADRLEDALDAADRLDGCKRKPRRRSRTLRHTVGVTREELEEARRMVDRDQLLPEAAKPITPPTSSTVSTAPSIEETSTPERKQSIDDQVSYHNAVESRQKTAPQVHNASYDPTPIINRDACVVERRAPQPRKPEFFRHSIADTAHQDLSKSAAERWNSETKSSIMAIANKFDTKVQKETLAPIRRAPINRPTVTIQQKNEEDLRRSSYYRPPPPGYNFAAPPPADDMSKPLNRFNNNSKRNRMKRANTIDIGRPLGGYKIDSDTEDENTNNQAPKVPEFQPQTENDRKFLAFMQKNQDNRNTTSVGQANWSNRFGNIKNAFENREKEENNRSSSASSAKRFWQTTNDTSHSLAPRPRKFLADITPEIVKPPWVSQRRDSLRNQFPAPAQISKQFNSTPATQPQNKQIVKPFVAKPIPVNQFSHAPMSAFKPPQKILSPTSAPPNVWIPPSSSVPVSPPVDNPTIPPKILNSLSPISSTPPSRTAPNFDQSRKSLGSTVSKFENDKFESQPPVPKQYGYHQPTTPTHVRTQAQNYPIKPIPSQNELAAPELVKKLDESKNVLSPEPYVPKVDARQLQIEFYERQIREKNRREASNERRDIPVHKPPAPPAPVYTIVDYTPQNGTATFVPLQQTPDIEKAKAHKVDYLPDVVMNETNNYNYSSSPKTRVAPASPSKPPSKIPQKQQNGVAHVNHCDDGTATEHDSVVTRVMRGPVRGAATITAGVRTRGAADSLRGVLDKISTPKHEVISQIERKKRDMARNQVRQPAPPSIRPGLSPPHAPSPPRPNQAFEYEGYPRSPAGLRSPALAASRESVFSSESPGSRDSSPGTALARSGSWHRFGEFGPKAASPRKVVARTKSMHLLAVPKLFEGGIANEELPEKKRTVEAYFTGRATSTRTSSQQTAHSLGRGRPARPSQPQSFALGRSRTMPTVSELQFLDESNADDAFEDLVSALA